MRSGVLLMLVYSMTMFGGLTGVLAAGEDAKKSGSALLDAALKRHVKGGLVDYNGIADDDNFQSYLKWLKAAQFSPEDSTDAALAFWVNAYNALAIKGVLENSTVKILSRRAEPNRGRDLADALRRRRKHGPATAYDLISSVLDVDGFFGSQMHQVAGLKVSLDHLEKKIVFPRFKDVRLHFVLVCAAVSCPGLASEAYTSENIQDRLDQIARKFLNTPEKNRLDQEHGILYLSQIFNWYRDDFSLNGGSVVDFVTEYLDADAQRFLSENGVKVEYLEYDWQLNSK